MIGSFWASHDFIDTEYDEANTHEKVHCHFPQNVRGSLARYTQPLKRTQAFPINIQINPSETKKAATIKIRYGVQSGFEPVMINTPMSFAGWTSPYSELVYPRGG